MLRAALIPLALVAVSAGCQTATDYEGRDRSVFFPAVRVTVPVRPKAPPDDELFIDFDLSGGRGSSAQTLGAGEFIEFDGATFNGPTTVSGDFDLYTFSVAARKPVPLGKKGWGSIFVGLGFEYLDLELSSGSLRTRDTSFSAGPLFGGRLGYRPWERLGLYGEFRATFGWGSGAFTTFGGGDLGVIAQATDQLAVFAGWRWWEYEEERDQSAVLLEMSGPFFGIEFGF